MQPTPEQEAIIREEKIGILATLRRNAGPQLTPVNYAYEDGRFLISVTRERVKYKNVKRNPNVSLCILRAEWRPYVTVYGRAVVEEEDIVEGTAVIARRMRDGPLPDSFEELLRRQGRVLIIMTPERFVP